MKHTYFTLAATAFALMSTSAMAGTVAIHDLPDEGMVTLQGTVDSIQNEREFTLRDATGTIDVDIESNQSLTLRKGDTVTLTGTIDKGVTGTDINASNVQVSKSMAQNVGDAIQSVPGVSTNTAQAYNIDSLPDEGMVKVSGTVSDVDNEKEFTLNKGIMGKSLDATQVIVISDAKPTAE
jgi:Bacterial OB fold (BOF) protein